MVVVNMSNSWHPRVRFGKQLGLVDCRKMWWIMNAFIKVCVWLFIYVCLCMPLCVHVCRELCVYQCFRKRGIMYVMHLGIHTSTMDFWFYCNQLLTHSITTILEILIIEWKMCIISACSCMHIITELKGDRGYRFQE